MHVSVNGVRLFFDVEGAKFVPDGPIMLEKADLAAAPWRPRFRSFDLQTRLSGLANIAQIVYLDHRGNGRNEDGPHDGSKSGAVGRRDDPMHPIESQADIAAALPRARCG